jgi:two-component system phosphate regulon response regulator OmpR
MMTSEFVVFCGSFCAQRVPCVGCSRCAAHARKILVGLEFDLIVLDVMMPGEDGVALTASLRRAD